MLALCVDMGPAAAAIAVEALLRTAGAPLPVLDAPTLARMQAASYLHADSQGGEDLDDEDEHGPLDDDGDPVDALDMLADMLGASPKHDPLGPDEQPEVHAPDPAGGMARDDGRASGLGIQRRR